MSKKKPEFWKLKGGPVRMAPVTNKRPVTSLLDAMREGNEYGSLIDVVPVQPHNMRGEVVRAIEAIEAIRGRPLIVYAGNVVSHRKISTPNAIVLGDDLPFSELVDSVPRDAREIDVLVVTPGGLGQQVAQFVNRLRPRFDHVAYILPHLAMSAGTIWVMSGDEIWMDERAAIGPIDPQVPGREGRFLPAQALLTLVEDIRARGEAQVRQGQQPQWTDIVILKNIDPKELGDARTASAYSIQLVAQYLDAYKFRLWANHASTGLPVTPHERSQRAIETATELCDHARWKAHSHGITRDVANHRLRLKINHLEEQDGLQTAVRRLWALLWWLFEHSPTAKVMISRSYSIFKINPKDVQQ